MHNSSNNWLRCWRSAPCRCKNQLSR